MKVLLKGLGIVAVIAIAIGFKFYNKGQTSDDVKAEVKKIVLELPDYKDHQKFYDKAFDHYHEQAFELSYSMGGRRSAAKFDEQKYFTVLLGLMKGMAIKANEKEIVASLDLYLNRLAQSAAEAKTE